MSKQSDTRKKTTEEMTPDEREAEHVRLLEEAVETAKSGVLKHGKRKSEPRSDESEKDGR